MSGAVAAHASYNGSGTQGLAVTNKIAANDSDVISVFWNKNDTTKQLLYGSSVMEIPTSGVSGTTSWGGNQIFTVNNDIDALGDLYLEVGVKADLLPTGAGKMGSVYDPASNTFVDSADTVRFNNFGLAQIVDRVEFQIGTQIWQTLEHDDILACNCTELGEGAFKKFGKQANGFFESSSAAVGGFREIASDDFNKAHTRRPNKLNVGGIGSIPGIASLSSAGNGALSLGTPLSAKRAAGDVVSKAAHIISSGSKLSANGDVRTMYLRLPLLTKTMAPELQGFTENCEGGYLMAAAPHQSVKIKVYFTDDLSKVFSDTHDSVVPTTSQVSIQPGKLYGRCMIMCNEERETMKSQPAGIPKRLKMTQNVNKSSAAGLEQNFSLDLDHFSLYSSHFIITVTGDPGCGLDTVELKLNSASFAGTIDAQLLDGNTAATMGLVSNSLDNPVDNNVRDVDQSNKALYVLPLASKAYGGSAVPLNRFDNIRLVLNFSKDAVVRTVNITCVGETTSLFKGGASSLAMY